MGSNKALIDLSDDFYNTGKVPLFIFDQDPYGENGAKVAIDSLQGAVWSYPDNMFTYSGNLKWERLTGTNSNFTTFLP